ncbi:hypothetical protein vseg_013515 [Gypsophila vaccaria]
MQRLEEKIVDMESEYQILRQQSLLNGPHNSVSEVTPVSSVQKLPNGHLASEDSRVDKPQSVAHVKKLDFENDIKLGKSQSERQHENLDALVSCVTKNIGFSQGKPVVAYTIYKCLLHWKSFEAQRTSVFDHLIQMIGSAIEDQDDNNETMAYWLSNTSALLFLLQRSLKASGITAAQRKPPPPTSLFGRMTMGFRSSPSTTLAAAAALEAVRQVEAKYPALLFKQQLTAYLEKIYGDLLY